MALFRGKLLLQILFVIFFVERIKGQTDPEEIPYDDCGGKDHDQEAFVLISGCENDDEVCKITRGNNVIMSVNWITYQSSIATLKSKLYIEFILGFKKEVKIIPGDACDYLDCPLTKNNEIHYVANFTVPEEIFTANGRIWWYGYENSIDDPLLCLHFPVEIA